MEQKDNPGGGPGGGRARLSYPPADWLQADAAADGLARARPGLSARYTLNAAQRDGLRRAVLIAAIVTLLQPQLPLILLALAAPPVFLAIILFRLFLALVARTTPPRPEVPAPEEGVTPLLPVYTILIALKDEAAIMPQLSQAMAGLDYPQARLDLKLLVEAADHATRAAIEREAWPPGTELVVVPPGRPQTKPRALNYGLARARGTPAPGVPMSSSTMRRTGPIPAS